jgi:hypothetical protein
MKNNLHDKKKNIETNGMHNLCQEFGWFI